MCDDQAVTDASSTLARSGAQTVERALALLRAFEATDEALSLAALAEHAALNASTARRLARVLTDGGVLIRNPATDRYQLGPTLAILGRKAENRLGYSQALPVLQQLSESTGESVNLGIRTGHDVQVVLDVPSTQPLRFDQAPGTRVPLYLSAMGKCLLAYCSDPDTVIRSLGELTRRTDRTITDPDRLRQELQHVCERGWALNDEERNPGVRAIAVPIRHDGAIAVGALAVQGPTIRVTDDRLPALALDLKTAAARIAPLLTPPTR